MPRRVDDTHDLTPDRFAVHPIRGDALANRILMRPVHFCREIADHGDIRRISAIVRIQEPAPDQGDPHGFEITGRDAWTIRLGTVLARRKRRAALGHKRSLVFGPRRTYGVRGGSGLHTGY